MTAMPPALPPGFECPPGTVPGWLNEGGEATSCVGDSPTPGEVYEAPLPLEGVEGGRVVTEAPVVFERDELAMTGAGDLLAPIVVLALGLAVGGATIRAAVRSAVSR